MHALRAQTVGKAEPGQQLMDSERQSWYRRDARMQKKMCWKGMETHLIPKGIMRVSRKLTATKHTKEMEIDAARLRWLSVSYTDKCESHGELPQ